jgi:hypothetical protein
MSFNGIILIPCFVKIGYEVQKWKQHADFICTVRTIISAPPLQNALSHTTAIGERRSSICIRSALV